MPRCRPARSVCVRLPSGRNASVGARTRGVIAPSAACFASRRWNASSPTRQRARGASCGARVQTCHPRSRASRWCGARSRDIRFAPRSHRTRPSPASGPRLSPGRTSPGPSPCMPPERSSCERRDRRRPGVRIGRATSRPFRSRRRRVTAGRLAGLLCDERMAEFREPPYCCIALARSYRSRSRVSVTAIGPPCG